MPLEAAFRKVAFWRDFGFMPARVVIAKFFAGVISIGGGCSLGREGPTVHIAEPAQAVPAHSTIQEAVT
jgi:H+/Cl- antiporter ClcA